MPETTVKTRKRAATSAAKTSTKGKVAAPVKTPTGRPTTFNQKTADLICLGLSEGMSLRQILKADKAGVLPAQSTVYEWLLRHPLFAEQYARAREEQADTNADEILEIADEMPPEYTDEKGRTSLDQTYIAWQKQRIEARKWTAMKLKPKKYGDKLALGGDGDAPPIKTEETSSSRLFEIIRNLEMAKRAG
jgi:hypothetical protein